MRALGCDGRGFRRDMWICLIAEGAAFPSLKRAGERARLQHSSMRRIRQNSRLLVGQTKL